MTRETATAAATATTGDALVAHCDIAVQKLASDLCRQMIRMQPHRRRRVRAECMFIRWQGDRGGRCGGGNGGVIALITVSACKEAC
jgi:hypothetical protein